MQSPGDARADGKTGVQAWVYDQVFSTSVNAALSVAKRNRVLGEILRGINCQAGNACRENNSHYGA
jgi:hypothetical protein